MRYPNDSIINDLKIIDLEINNSQVNDSKIIDYAVIGGDKRQVYLAEELAKSAKRVIHFALCEAPDTRRFPDFISAASSLEEACSLASCVIGPIPLCRGGSHINQTAVTEPISSESFFSSLSPGQTLFGGCIPSGQSTALQKKGIRTIDLMEDASLSYYNTIATAEGAICEAIRQSPCNLHRSACAILGYGKCGRTLCQYLKGMSCYTYVAARREEVRAQALLLSDQAGDMEDFMERAGSFDFIFNTAPALLITGEALAKLKPTVTIIDIASAPGGVDADAAKALGITSVFCPGLPGIYAPASSAAAIKETVLRIQKEG